MDSLKLDLMNDKAGAVRVGIIGGGRGGSALLDVLLHAQGAEVVALCDIDSRATAMLKARRYAIPTYTSVEMLLERHDLDWLINVSHSSVTQRHLLVRELDEVKVVDGATAELIWRVLCETRPHTQRATTDDEATIFHELAWKLIYQIVDSLTSLQQELTDIAFRDPLTGLFNRRILMDFLHRQLKAARRENKPVSLIVSDVDHFKSINDNFGHQAGDRILVQLGRLFSKSVRASDLEARLGGEEFAIVLPRTDEAEAFEIAERIRSDISRSILRPDGQPLTMSFGIARWSSNEFSEAAGLLEAADQALYRAKAYGRDKVVVHK